MKHLLVSLLAVAVMAPQLLAADQVPPPNQTVIAKREQEQLAASKKAAAPVKEDPASAALRPVMEKRYAALKKAMEQRDEKATSKLLAPDFTSTDVSGKTVDMKQMFDTLKQVPKDAARQTKTTLKTVQLAGNVATVQQHYEMWTTKENINESDGGDIRAHLITDSTDTWVKKGGSWLLQKTATNNVDLILNGKTVTHKVRPQ